MLRSMKAGLVAATAVAIAACGTTTFQSTWTAPDAGPLKLEEGTKVIGMVASGNTARRHGMEAALANELSEHGLEGIPAYSVVPPSMAQDAAAAKPFIDKTGASYAVVLQVTGTDKKISSSPSMGYGMWGAPGGFYGPGWGGYGWGWGGGQEIRTDTLVGVQTLLYDIKADKLVWAGQSETMNPSKAESFVRELIRAVGDELQKDGLVGPPKR